MDESRYFKYSIYIIGFLALAGIALIISATSKFGPGISEDSIAYIAAAKNILNFKELSVLFDLEGNQLNLWLPRVEKELYHILPWPPLFPFIISIFGFLHFNLARSAGLINAILFGANIALILLIIRKYTRSLVLIIFSSIILITSKNMLLVHSFVWSEPLFLFLGLLGFYFLFCFLDNKKNYNFIISALCFSLAFFTRTVGISLIAAGVTAILFFSRLKIKNKIIYSILLSVIGFLPFSIWTLKNNIIFGNTTTGFFFHPASPDDLIEAVRTVSSWFYLDIFPFKIYLILLMLVLTAITAVSIYISRKNKKRSADAAYKQSSRVINIFLLFALFYITAILFARSFFDASIPLDNRILIPVFIPAFIIIILLVKRALDYFKNKRAVKRTIFIFCEILLVFSLSVIIFGMKGFYEEGQGYNSRQWLESETIRELKDMDPSEAIYTNNPYAIYFYLDKNPRPLPTKVNIYTAKKNTDYSGDLNKTIEEIRKNNGLIVLFDLRQYYLAEEKELLMDHGLTLIKDTRDGAIYKAR